LVYACQYQQRPAPAEGNIVKHTYIRRYGGTDPRTGILDETLPSHFDLKLISVDCAFKDAPTSDLVAILVIGVKGRKRYVLHAINEHLDSVATERAIREQRNLFGPIQAVLIEDAANGPAIIQRLKCNMSGVIAVKPGGGKLARMHAAAPEWEAGDWYVPRNAPWAEAFVEQLTSFPNGRYDDLCDAMSQAAIWLPQYEPIDVRMTYAFSGKEIPGAIRSEPF
jgi:predicted phage terminase large subunit-like protein